MNETEKKLMEQVSDYAWDLGVLEGNITGLIHTYKSDSDVPEKVINDLERILD